MIYDVDRDGHDELVFAHETVWCLIAPREGARVCLLAHRAPDHMRSNVYPEGAAVIVGNPVDHWNFQEELNQFMDIPPGHPGALTDRYPHRAWVADVPYRQSDAVTVEVRPAQPDAGTVSRCYALIAGIPALAACLHTEPGEPIDSTLIPDYLGALHDGAAGVQPSAGCCWRGWSWSSRQCWLGFDPDQAVPVAPRWSTAGHGGPVALTSPSGHLDVLLGAGSVTDSDIRHWLSAARRILHESSRAPQVWSTTTPAGNESGDGCGAARPE